MSITQTNDPVNSFEARRRYLKGNIETAAAAMNRAYEILKELSHAHGVAQELYEVHVRGAPLTPEQAARKYARDKAVHDAIEAEKDIPRARRMVAEAVESATKTVAFARRIEAEAAEAKREAERLQENL